MLTTNRMPKAMTSGLPKSLKMDSEHAGMDHLANSRLEASILEV